MKLTFEQIKSITVGAVEIEQQQDGIHFYRCTRKQIDAWSHLGKALGERAACSTGIRLDFETDARELRFCVSRGTKFEVDIDGLLRAQFAATPNEEIRVPLCDPLGSPLPKKRVTLYFPSHGSGAVLKWVELDDGAYVVPHRFARKLLLIGDSITQGWEADFDSLSFAYRLSRHFNADSVIQGIGGAYYHESTFDQLPFSPDAVLVAYGTNDFGVYKTLAEFRAHVAAYLALLSAEYRDKPIFILSPIWRDRREGKTMGSFAECRAVVREEAERLQLCHIDGLKLVPPLPVFFKDEYLHPNDNGFSVYAENLIRELEPLL